jgi:hypothetical protein
MTDVNVSELFDNYEEDFTDEVLEETFDASKQVIIRYGTEEFAATVKTGQTLIDIVRERSGEIGVSDIHRLNFKVETVYVTPDYTPKPGEVITASANSDSKGY